MTAPGRAGLAAVLLLPLATWIVAHAQTPAPAAKTPPPIAGPVTTGFRALDYFQTNCARCHGDYGAAYGLEFGKNLTDRQLQDFVRDMAEGPAQAPLSDADLAVVTDFHRALRDGRPFGGVVAWKGGVLSGEALPGSTVSLELPGQTLDVPLDGNAWKIAVPADTPWAKATLRITRDKKETVIPLAKRAL